ncbi:hypothetical protein PWT90_04186 [Aphanocladium album]|nr:hypothetical protein PWT90_04186 [Aphanocladium album]
MRLWLPTQPPKHEKLLKEGVQGGFWLAALKRLLLKALSFNVDQSPLVDGRLLTSELNALIVLATKYDFDPVYADIDEFVITVFTGSDRQLRIAQSKVNLAEKTFDVSLSRIIDFGNSIGGNWEDWKLFLGWFACSKPSSATPSLSLPIRQ